MKKRTHEQKQKQIYNMTLIGILGGLNIFLTLTTFGFIAIGPISITTMHIPVIIAALIGGPFVGGAVGLIFGLSSMLNAVMRPGLFSPVFLNPFIAIIPRVLIGVAAAYTYSAFKQRNQTLALYLSSAIGTLVNSVLVLLGIYIFYQHLFADAQAATVLLGIFTTNALPELFFSLIIVPPIVKVVQRMKR